MSPTPTSENPYPRPPESPGNHLLLALGLAIALAAAAGVRAGWEAAVAVLVGLLGLFVAYGNSTKE